jgi:hypothetical protein
MVNHPSVINARQHLAGNKNADLLDRLVGADVHSLNVGVVLP